MEKNKKQLQDMKICRFCLTSDEKELTSIYQKDPKMIPLTVQIMSCISIEVFPTDGLPQLICNTCKQQTNQSYVFKSNCKKADDALKNFFRTGGLVKPDFPKVPKVTKRGGEKILPVKDVKIVENDAEPNTEHSKRVKLQDGTEIITLCITPSESSIQDESSRGSNLNNEEDNTRESEGDVYGESDNVEAAETHIDEKRIYSCDLCDKSFLLKQLLELHLKNHERIRKFSCSSCDSKFYTKYDLAQHCRNHCQDKSFSCSVCLKLFSTEPLLTKHELTHCDKFTCPHCDKNYGNQESLDNHMKKHDKKKAFVCTKCEKSFVFKQGLLRHLVIHNQDMPFKCTYCDDSFNSQFRLTRHITTHAGLRPYPCKVCGRTFLLSHHLTRHMRSHYAAGQGRKVEETILQHKCDICSMSFRRKDSLINHSAIHSMVNLRCVICNTSFKSANAVKEHITTHLQGLPYPCENCDYSFESEEQLETHQLTHAVMEYEEQIEQEVISEVNRSSMTFSDYEEYNTFDEDENEGEVAEYHITSIDNPELVPSRPSVEENRTEDELSRDIDDNDGDGNRDKHDIKPVVRLEGAKVYERKRPLQRKIPTIEIQDETLNTAISLDEIDEKPSNIKLFSDFETEPVPHSLSKLPSKKPANVKVGDKVVKVQKYLMTKDEMKQMAKMGILEVKNGQVIMKNPGQPFLNATIKPAAPSDIETLLSNAKRKSTTTQYQRRNESST
ncbi:zinc finger protein 774-like isoform X1 [Sitophilus oryzae]|uniref:Zinc finger protein 774-like isoform X1 n=1 Tax=Sitophilus oryzae TaxID=7048 RepID=A0A6J2XD71_SITOR|nr:zinc finger protein 774-like isoform X1 [Sitophilus oryzae]